MHYRLRKGNQLAARMRKNLLLLFFTVAVFGNLLAYGGILVTTEQHIYSPHYRGYKMRQHKSHETACRVPHPYFGQLNCYDKAPQDGGISAHEKLLIAQPPAPQNAVRVLVLGGSLASHFSRNITPKNVIIPPENENNVTYDHAQILQESLTRHFSTQRFVVHNAALGGGKQPQQLFKLQYLLMRGMRYDIVINLDGYNEISWPLTRNRDFGNHVAYPLFFSRMVEQSAASYDASCIARANRYASSRSGVPLIEVAQLGYIRWCSAQVAGEKMSADNAVARASAYAKQPDAEVLAQSVALWQNSSLAIAKLADIYGFEYIHAIQPNQHDKGSKPLSAIEAEHYLDYATYGEPVRRHYKQLNFDFWPPAQEATLLDLRNVFKDNRKTLYRDDCCHLSNYGVALLADALIAQTEPIFLHALNKGHVDD